MIIRADLHLHSCLSPCGSLEMSPKRIARELAAKDIHLAALTDHNSALNCPAFAFACHEYDITPLFGIEAQTREECHILCLFPDLDSALKLGEIIYALMPPVMNIPEKTGDQVYVDELEDVIGSVDKFLVVSADMGIDDLVREVLALGGILIPAHVDRPSFSMTSQLGTIIDGPWAALEMMHLPGEPPRPGAAPAEPVDTKGYPLISSSDAHYPAHVGKRAFDLDIDDSPLCRKDGKADMETIKAALLRRPRS